MKATTLVQSKKLLELGIDPSTADMSYLNDGTAIKIDAYSYNHATQLWKDYYVEIIPCWSFVALLQYLKELKPLVYLPVLFVNDNKWTLQFVERGHGNTEEITSDNPVDACFEMILRLHEQKLL